MHKPLCRARQQRHRAPQGRQGRFRCCLFLGLQLVLHVVCALIANRLYFKKTTGDLHALHEQTLGESEYRLQLFKKGGTSLLFGFSSYVLYDIAYMLVIQLLAQIL